MVSARKILRYLLGFILLTILGLIPLFQLPSFQTFVARKAVAALQDKVDGKIEIESVHFKFINTIVIKGICITDLKAEEGASDTLAVIGSLSARFSPISLFSHNCLSLKSVKLKDSRLNLAVKHGEMYNNNLKRIFRIPKKDTTHRMTTKPILHIGRVEVENMEYSMRILSRTSKARHPWNVDWTDMEATNINMLATDFNIRDALFTGKVHELNFEEKSGWKVLELSCNFKVGRGKTELNGARLRDTFGTDIEFDYKMLGRKYFYRDYKKRVRMDGVFKKSRVSMSTLAAIVPPMYPDSLTFATLTGHVFGPVVNLHLDSLSLGFENNCVHALVDGYVSGMPDKSKMRIDSRISDIRFTTRDLTRILKSLMPGKKVDLRKFGKGCSYSGTFETEGLLNDIRADLLLKQRQGREERGSVNMNLKLDNVLAGKSKPMTAKGHVSTSMLDLRELLEKEIANDISLSADIDLQLPCGKMPLRARIDSLMIDNLEYRGYTYSGIDGSAALDDRDINASLHARDSALNADVRLWTDETKYNAALDVRMADLHKMNLDSKKMSIVHCGIRAELLGKDFKKPQGNVQISDIRLYNDSGTHLVEDVRADAALDGEKYTIGLESGQTSGVFFGNKEVFDAELQLGETLELLSFIKPGLYVEKGTSVSVRKDSMGCFYGTLHSGRIALNRNYIKDISGNISGPPDSLEARFNASDICAAGFHLRNSRLRADYVNSLLTLNYGYLNTEKGHHYEGNLDGSALINPDKSVNVKLSPSFFVFDGKKWDLKESDIRISDGDIAIDGFMFSHEGQYVKLDGGIRADAADTLVAGMKNIDMSFLNFWTKNKNLELQGVLNADGWIISPRVMDMMLIPGLPKIELDLMADSLRMNGRNYGHLEAACEYEHDLKRFRADISDDIDARRTLSSRIYFTPETKDLAVTANLDRFPFGFLSALTTKIFSGLDGMMTADIAILKNKGLMDLRCNGGRIDNGMLEIAYTHVPYYIDGTFNMDNEGVHFKEMLVRDRAKGKSIAKGGVKWDRLKNMQMDMHLDVRNMEALDIPSNRYGAAFYGNVIASGKVDLTGPVKNMLLTADTRTTGLSNMHFLVSGKLDATKGDMLKFVDPYVKEIDPYIKMIQQQDAVVKAKSGMNLKIHVDADENFKANLDMNKTGFAAGAVGIGKGTIDLDVDTRTKSYSILGDYRLDEGTFDFNASEIVHRQFNIKEGGIIKFRGTMPMTELNIEADYQTKASIAPLIADTTSVSNRRLVECGIQIRGKLTDPSISFSINIPDLDPSIQSSVESALNTEAKVQRQFLSLLVSNNFLPSEENGIVNNSSILYSNVSELMANQINNIFAKLDIPLDLGLNYQPGDKGAGLFDVALSTQLWNNRVIIGGSLGNRQSTNSTKTTIFGDLDIEYKVTQNGAFRVKAFSHAADQYSNYLDQSQRNGIGATWQQEFDDISIWWKQLFMKKKDRVIYMNEQNRKAKETKTLILDE